MTVLILGDSNIHVCCPSSLFTSDFIKLLDYFNLTQYVKHDQSILELFLTALAEIFKIL